jgi:hypothetical protein
MAVKQEIKSQLAKLLATEDLVVEHKDVPTAQFNVHTRELLLPLWEKATDHVYDMLVGHEVGHALFTPDEEMGVEVPAQFLNVVEDVRIEKLMKRKYLGIAKTFYRGYNELHDKDFFEINDQDVDTLNLADRVNLHYKVGTFVDISFTDAEAKIVEIIDKCETFKEAKEAAKILYDYCRQEVNEQVQEKKVEDTEGELELPKNEEGAQEENIDSQEVEDESKEDAQPAPPKAEVEKKPEVQTADSLESHLQDLIKENGKENVYLEVPDLDVDSIIATNEAVHNEIDKSWKQQQDFINEHTDRKSNLFEEADAEYDQFKRDAQKEVNYLVKEFEMKKSASAYARASTARTGVLDTSKLHTYKFNDDIFKKITVLPDGKNHGLLFVLDWSGSMSHVMQDTIKQLFNLIWFCRKVNIPFEVYAFTNEWRRREQDATGQWNPVTDMKPYYEEEEYNLRVEEAFSLMNLFTSKVRSNEFDHQLKNIWRIATCFSRTYYTPYTYPVRLCLSGTPLNEALMCLHKILPRFQKENDVEKVQCVVLTDGEANTVPYHVQVKDYFGSDEWKMGMRAVNPETCSLRDRKLGKVYRFGYSWHQFTEVLLRNLKDKFPESNFIGIRVLPPREASYFLRRYCDDPKDYERCQKDWRKLKTFSITSGGYDTYFGMSANALADDTEFEVKDGATKGQIKNAFVKSLKTKKLNKKVLGEFVSLVA